MLTVDGERLNALSTDDLQYFETRFFLVPGTGTVYVDAKLSVIRQRAVGDGFHEELTILNHDDEPVDLAVRLEAGSDFADLFEVKDALEKKGEYYARVEDGRLLLGYEREAFRRETEISATAPAKLDEDGLTFTRSDRAARRVVDRPARRQPSCSARVGSTSGRSTHEAKRASAEHGARASRSGSRTRRGSNATGSRCARRTAAASSTSPRCASRRSIAGGEACRPRACRGS